MGTRFYSENEAGSLIALQLEKIAKIKEDLRYMRGIDDEMALLRGLTDEIVKLRQLREAQFRPPVAEQQMSSAILP